MPDLSKKAIEAMSQHFLSENVDTIFFLLLGIILNLLGAALLLRIALAVKHSRFLRHLAIFYGFLALSKIAYLIIVIFIDRVAVGVFLVNPAGPTPEQLEEVKAAIARIETFGAFVDVILSFLTSFWLCLTWRILIRYPQEVINKEEFRIAVAVFGSLIGFVAYVAAAYGVEVATPSVIQFGDVAISTVMLVIIGFELRRIIGKARQLMSITMHYCVFAAYFVWAALQPMYWAFKTDNWYRTALLLASFVAMLLTALYATRELEDKEEF